MPELAGTLRQRFTLERPSDASGSVVFTAIDDRVWGDLVGLSGIESPAIQASADHRMTVYYRGTLDPLTGHMVPDLTVRDRLRLGARVFNIVSVTDPDGMRRRLDLLVREQV